MKDNQELRLLSLQITSPWLGIALESWNLFSIPELMTRLLVFRYLNDT